MDESSHEEPRCPFCYHIIEQPKELQSRKIVEFPLGVCGYCGVVYVYDTTGHNMGAAFIEALLFACNGMTILTGIFSLLWRRLHRCCYRKL